MRIGGGRRTEIVCRLLDVEDHDFNVPGCKKKDNMFPYSITASGDDHKILAPVPLVTFPIIQYTSVQNAIEPSRQPKVYEYLQIP